MIRFASLVALFTSASVSIAAPPAVSAVAYMPDGKSVAFGRPGEVRLFDTENAEARGYLKTAGRVTALAFAPNGKWLAAASGESGKDGLIELVALKERADGIVHLAGDPTFSVTGHKDSIYALAFSPDSRTLATAGYDRLIHLWDVSDAGEIGKLPRLTLKDHSDTIYSLSFHPDGQLLASGAADRAVKVWDTATGKRLYTLGDPTDWVYCVAWSPDKKHLLAGGVDKSVRVWAADRNGGKLIHSVYAHEKPVWRVAYADAGATVFTAGEDRIIKAWDTSNMTEKKVYNQQPEAILDFAVSPSGKQIAIARFDGVGVHIDAGSGKQTAQLLPPKPATPKPDRIVPAGVQIGKTTTVTVTGTNLDFATGVIASRPHVRVLITERAPGSLKLSVEVPAEDNVGVVDLTLDAEAGKSGRLKLALDPFASVAETGITDSARAAQRVKLPATVVGAIDRAGDVDFFRFEAKAGDEIGIQLVASEIGSKLDPVLVLSDSVGTTLDEGNATLGFVVPKSGTYAIGIRDREFRGGADFTYRLHVGDLPVVTGVFPLAVPRGRTVDVHVDGVNLGTPGGVRTSVTVPPDAVPGTRIAVPVPKSALGKPELTVSEFTSVVIDPVAGAELRVPGAADGILTKPNESQVTRFRAKKGERLAIDVLARRAGSPVDSVIEILDAGGQRVPRALLRSTAKTFTTFRDHDSSGPGIRLDTWNELRMDDYLYVNGELLRILALPKGPDDDCQFYQVAGQRMGYLGTTPAQHSQGSPMYKVEIHAPGRSFPPNGLPVFTLDYRNDDGGPGFGKDSFLLFDAPADGTYQIRIADTRGANGHAHSYRLTVRPPKPDFTVSFTPISPSVWKGGAIPVAVTITRKDGFDGAVRVQLEGLPPGFHAPATFVEAGQTTTSFALFAEAGATVPPETRLKLVARGDTDGKEVIREATGGQLKLMEPGDLEIKASVSGIAIKPGHESRFFVDIERRGKFAGRVPVEVRGLPHGVRVLNIGLNGILITERETRREVVLYAEPWVKPMEHPIVVLARSEGKNTDHATRSVQLKVDK